MIKMARVGEDNFLELRFEITRRTDQSFQLTLSSTALPSHIVTSTFFPPLTAKEIEAELSAVPNTLDEFQRSSQRASPRDAMKRLGESLFVSLLEGHPGKLYQQTLDIAASTSQGLRIKLSVDDPELDALPWEFLYDPMRGDFLALSANSPVLRTRPSPRLIDPIIEPPLRILVVTSEVVPVDADAEVQRIEALKDKGAVFETIVLKQTNLTNFFDAIRHEQFHVLHIIAGGRTEYKLQGSEPYLASELSFVGNSPNSPPVFVEAKQLRYLCADKKDLRFICLSADKTDQMASQLAAVCPAVIGWRGANSTSAYVSFSDGLYSSLLLGLPLEIAMTEARQRVDLDQPGGKEWGMPVCYLQAPHGAFFPNSRRSTSRSARPIDPVLEQKNAVQDSSNTRPWKKLYALLEIEHRNLTDIEEQVATYPDVDAVPAILKEQHNATKTRIEELELKLKELT